METTKAKSPKQPATPARQQEEDSVIVVLLQQKEGATLAEIITATSWQAHSEGGFISRHLGKKLGLIVESTKSETGERTYGIAN